MRDMDRKKPGNLGKIRRFAFSGFFFLFSVALIVQVLLSSAGLRHQEEQTAKMESLSQAMSTKMQKLSKDFLAASREAKGDVVSDMAAIQKRSPGASDLRWWDRGVLDSAYGSKEKASSFGFARLADAERLMAGNEKLLSFSSFARIPNVQEPVIVLSARSGERVIQVLTPSTDVLVFFQKPGARWCGCCLGPRRKDCVPGGWFGFGFECTGCRNGGDHKSFHRLLARGSRRTLAW